MPFIVTIKENPRTFLLFSAFLPHPTHFTLQCAWPSSDSQLSVAAYAAHAGWEPASLEASMLWPPRAGRMSGYLRCRLS